MLADMFVLGFTGKMRMMLMIAFGLLLSMSIAECSRPVDDARILASCNPAGFLSGISNDCNRHHGAECCETGQRYPQFKCSPPVTGITKATLTLNGFGNGDDGGGASECDGDFHSDDEKVVALSTGWYAGGSRCNDFILITNPDNGRSVRAKVVDECDSVAGCDDEHAFQPPCKNNIVDASPAVWKALGVDNFEDVGVMSITWSET
ncbi:hypothetical protein SUGI_0240220 [Cryptomeria japonica]|uniref:kiwellin-1-like n=1 Tax=Cryptomeria japonica TaxID=3369 RepID=UPI002408B402|nr:kiwellin-1-like [Cryptomeria japonica]GLJ14797.1 hypothetical protein SUGI_0240220 [Cryptomeria japonica]